LGEKHKTKKVYSSPKSNFKKHFQILVRPKKKRERMEGDCCSDSYFTNILECKKITFWNAENKKVVNADYFQLQKKQQISAEMRIGFVP
jgi:hypothetical protein